MSIGNGREASPRTPPNKNSWQRGQWTNQEWVSKGHREWELPTEEFRNPVATDGSLLEVTGKCGACGWPVLQLHYDGRGDPLCGRYGAVQAELEVQRDHQEGQS